MGCCSARPVKGDARQGLVAEGVAEGSTPEDGPITTSVPPNDGNVESVPEQSNDEPAKAEEALSDPPAKKEGQADKASVKKAPKPAGQAVKQTGGTSSSKSANSKRLNSDPKNHDEPVPDARGSPSTPVKPQSPVRSSSPSVAQRQKELESSGGNAGLDARYEKLMKSKSPSPKTPQPKQRTPKQSPKAETPEEVDRRWTRKVDAQLASPPIRSDSPNRSVLEQPVDI